MNRDCLKSIKILVNHYEGYDKISLQSDKRINLRTGEIYYFWHRYPPEFNLRNVIIRL